MTQHGAYSDQEARTYDSDRGLEPLWHVENAYMAALLRRTSTKTVLDVPVGTGRFLDLYADCDIVGVDLSEAMLEQATRKAMDLDLQSVELLKGSVISLPFNDRSFDMVVCWRLLHLLPPQMLEGVFAELRRVCRGTLCIQCYANAPLFARITAKGNRWIRRAGLLFRRQRALTPWSHIRAYSHSQQTIETAAAKAGLTDPDRVEDFGAYEGTRVLAMEWTVAG